MMLGACRPTRYVPKNSTLLRKNIVKMDSVLFEKDQLLALVKQKPNRKVFGVFYPYTYFYYKGSKGEPTRFKNWLKEIGEEPAILDTALNRKTKNQIDLFLKKHGFFNSIVTDTVVIRKNQAEVYYNIELSIPYLLRKTEYLTRDSMLMSSIAEISSGTLLKTGDIYNEETFEKERERITSLLKNIGYYTFSKNFVTYQVDTNLNDHKADIKVYLNRLNENAIKNSGEAPVYHSVYTYRNLYIQSDFNPKDPTNSSSSDTAIVKDYFFLSKNGFQTLRPPVLANCIFFKRGDVFNQKEINYSYQRIQNLNTFRYININFKEVPRDSTHRQHQLDGFLQMSAMARQDFTVEADATNTGGNLGLAGSIGYRNKNLFRGAEVLEIKMKGGVQSLPNFSDSTIQKKLFFFNTYELGPELSLQFKEFLLPNFIRRAEGTRRMNPRTILTSGYNLQDRPDYRRSILKLSMSYTWRSSATRSYAFTPMEVNSVSVIKSTAFQSQLDSLKDPQLQYSYDTHLISSMRFSYVYSGQQDDRKHFFFMRANFESAGFLLSSLSGPLQLKQNNQGVYELFSIPFSQYIKPDVDLSFHHTINNENSIIYRLNAGVGIPYGNSSALPFEKSYFAGGANSMRAWIAYTLGPGTYVNTQGIEQTGDIKLESNIEYRCFLMKIMGTGAIEGALFTDIGNIWTLNVDPNRPGTQFKANTFIDQVGIGSGLGLRFNFSFFILRLDMAVKMRDPGYEKGSRWVYPNHKFGISDVTPNLAIGYPF